MGKLIAQEKSTVVPGEELAEGMDFLPGFGAYRSKDHIVASRLGMFNVENRTLKVTPLSGRYMPLKGDVIIGKVIDIFFSGWRIETNCAYPAMLSLKDATADYISKGADLTRFFNIGDYVVCKVINVTSQKLIDLTAKGPGLHKLHGGRVIEISTNKVPRLIGQAGSMVTMIKQETNCNIIVGQNGLVWIDGEPQAEYLAVQAIRKIEDEAHIPGLTDRVKALLESGKVKK